MELLQRIEATLEFMQDGGPIGDRVDFVNLREILEGSKDALIKLSALQTELTEQRDENDALLDRYDQRIAALKAERDGYASRLGAGERLVQRACGLLSRLPEEVKLVGDRGQWVQDAADWLCVVETAPPTNSGPISSELVVERQLIDIAPGYVCPGCGRPYTAPGCPDCGSTGEHAFSCSQRSHPSE